MYVYMYVYVYMYMCMYVCLYVYMYVYMYVICMYVYSVYMWTDTEKSLLLSTHTSLSIGLDSTIRKRRASMHWCISDCHGSTRGFQASSSPPPSRTPPLSPTLTPPSITTWGRWWWKWLGSMRKALNWADSCGVGDCNVSMHATEGREKASSSSGSGRRVAIMAMAVMAKNAGDCHCCHCCPWTVFVLLFIYFELQLSRLPSSSWADLNISS